VSPYLGMNSTLSIAVMPFGLASTRASVRRLGLNGVMRRGFAGELYVTDNANLILEVSLPEGIDLDELDTELHRIPGVVEHGLFLNEADAILIEHQGGEIETLLAD
jgi:ribose 5-phosphate isomerase A